MDFIRSTVKALFVEFPLNAASLIFSVPENDETAITKFKLFKDLLKEILKRTQRSFTSSNIEDVLQIIFEEWLIDSHPGLKPQDPIDNRLFVLLPRIGKMLLNISEENPRVKFDNLLRWRDLTFHSSEDLITIPTLASEKSNGTVPKFLWPDVLRNDCEWLNALFDEGLCDIHSHLAASAEPALINWIIFMNHPELARKINRPTEHIVFQDDTQCHSYHFTKDSDPFVPTTLSGNMPFSCWIKLAAYIRAELFERLNELKDNDDWNLNIEFLKSDELDKEDSIINKVAVFNTLNTPDIQVCKTSNGLYWDYAINSCSTSTLSDLEKTSPYMLLYGERHLLYDYFVLYYSGDDRYIKCARYVWLYILIRNKFRREVISSNNLIGFLNFQEYYGLRNVSFGLSRNRKDCDSEEIDFYNKCKIVNWKYAIQTARGDEQKHCVEARMGYNDYKALCNSNFNFSIFNNVELFSKENCGLTVVVHFMKSDRSKHAPLRLQKDEYKDDLKKIRNHLTQGLNFTPPLTGVDACSNELSARPYVFGSIFRSLAECGMTNQTFHIGEDFHDMIDGLRGIDETILHLDTIKSLRLGLALALGLDIRAYYEYRHYIAILPVQVLLDNMVWLKFTAQDLGIYLDQQITDLIDKTFQEAVLEIGYSKHIDASQLTIECYWADFRARGMDDPLDFQMTRPSFLSLITDDSEIANAGGKVIEIKLPSSIVHILEQIQLSLKKRIEEKGIIIECNPTSNLIIGPFERYEQHPMFSMNHPSKDEIGYNLNVTISTDNKGIMATSIENEFSLMAAAKLKGVASTDSDSLKNIKEYFSKIKENGRNARFLNL